MIVEKTYSLNIDELSDEIGRLLKIANLGGQQQDNRVSPVPDMRTIRYYSGLGLLDRPAISGRVARYSSRHVLQLLAIKILQGASLPLAEIQEKLYGLSDSELEQIISMYLDDGVRQVAAVQLNQTSAFSEAASAADYRSKSSKQVGSGRWSGALLARNNC